MQALERFIAREVVDKGIPALSIALVEDQTVIWSKAFGFADTAKQVPATVDTLYRVGSVTKLFTAFAGMRLVEQGALDLDAPITRYLPDFQPRNPFDQAITLRHLMAHRSGLVREPPIGNYYDDSRPPLTHTVASLNQTELVYAPQTRTKYSNAAIATVGLVLEQTQKEPFPGYLRRTLLEPLNMTKSHFESTPAVTKDLAATKVGTYHGRYFQAPNFGLGMAPASDMYSTVTDLACFIRVLLASGRGPGGPMLKPETMEQMWTPQFVNPGEKCGFGLGFYVSELDGRRRIGHGGALLGFVAELAVLPGDKLGVIVAASRHGVTAVMERIADEALRQLLAARKGPTLPAIEETESLRAGDAARLAGRYRSGDKVLDLVERTGRLWALLGRGGFRVEVRRLGNAFMVDDRLAFGPKLVPEEDRLRIGEDVYEQVPAEKPEPAPAKWQGLIGEYGPVHNILYVLEKDGRLHVLVEWFFLYPLTEESANVYAFPDSGMYHGEKLIIVRDGDGRATKLIAVGLTFPRRPLDGEDGRAFRVQAQRPIEELRRAALAAEPPEEKGDFRPADLVELTALDDTLRLDIRYATTSNFLSTKLYTSPRAFLQRPAAEALVRIHRKLRAEGYGLLIHDAYRPWHVTRMLRDATPEACPLFVADPAQGSRHNRGCSVDLTLYDLATGRAVEMVGNFKEVSDRAYADYLGGTSIQRWHRDLLRRSMEEEGFTVDEAAWWHFDHRDWEQYRISNRTFEDIDRDAPDR